MNIIRKELMDIYGIEEVFKILPGDIVSNQPEQEITVKANISKQADKNFTEELKFDTWDELSQALNNCNSCKLSSTRQNIVFGEGNKNAELMLIGEGPGENEDKTGRPFIGAAGQLLTKMIEAMKFSREDVYIANVVKCRPPQNREPFQEEVDACIDFLLAQIQLVKPKVIVCLGFTAAKHLLKKDTRTYSFRGAFQDYKGIKVMPTYHPAFLLYNPNKKRDVWTDLQQVMKLLGK